MRRWEVQRTVARRSVALALTAVVLVTAFVLVGISGYAARAAVVGLRSYLAAAAPQDASVQLRLPRGDDPAAQDAAVDRVLRTVFGDLPLRAERTELPPSGAGGRAVVVVTIVTDTDRVTPDQVPAMATAVDRVATAVRDDRQAAPQGREATGGLAGTLRAVRVSLRASLAVGPVPTLLVAAIGLVMLIQLARLLTLDRRGEVALVRSRGASTGQLTRLALAEAAVLAVPGAVIGVGLAVLVLSLAGARPDLGAALVTALVVVSVSIAVLVVPAMAQARAPANRSQIDYSGRTAAVVAGAGVLVVAVVAAVAMWRFKQLGSAVLVDATGRTTIDPIAVLAPALLLIALATVAGAVFGQGARAVQRLAARHRGIGGVLAARQVSRRGVLFGVAVLLITVAVGSTVLAASYGRTQQAAQERADALRNGPPVLVSLGADDPQRAAPFHPVTAPVSGVPEVGLAVPAMRLAVGLGAVDATLTATAVDTLAAVTAAVPGTYDPAAFAAVAAVPPTGWQLPDGADQVSVTATIAASWTPPSGTAAPESETVEWDTALWVVAPDGSMSHVRGTPVEVPVAPEESATPTTFAVEAALPGLPAGARLVALDLTTGVWAYPVTATVVVTGVTAGGIAVDTSAGPAWAVQPQPTERNPSFPNDPEVAPFTAPDTGIGWSGTVPRAKATVVRLTPEAPGALPLVVEARLATAARLEVGDLVDLTLSGDRVVPAQIARITPVLPGEAGPPRMFADLAALSTAMLRAAPFIPGDNELWIAPAPGVSPARAGAAVTSAMLGAGADAAQIRAVGSRTADALIAPAAATLWIGAAGALLLAMIGMWSTVAILARERSGDLVVLRAAGLSARAQAAGRRRELLVTLAAAVLLGLLVGGVTVLSTVTDLAGSALVGAGGLRPTVQVDPRAAVLLVVFTVVLVLLVFAHGRSVRAAAAAATPTSTSR